MPERQAVGCCHAAMTTVTMRTAIFIVCLNTQDMGGNKRLGQIPACVCVCVYVCVTTLCDLNSESNGQGQR